MTAENKTISELDEAATLDGTEEAPVVQDSATAKTTTQDIADLCNVVAGVTHLAGTADPSAGGGVVAGVGSVYYETDAGKVWMKTSAPDTGWEQLAFV